MSIDSKNKSLFFHVIKNLREQSNLSVNELSKKLKLSKSTIDNYEFKMVLPPFRNIIKIASFFGITIDYLILGKKTKYIKNMQLFQLASRIDNSLPKEKVKIESYIETFLIRKNKVTKIFDHKEYLLTKSFNTNLSILTAKSPLSGKEISGKLNISEQQLSNYKRRYDCTFETLIKLSDFFNISMHWILTGEKIYFDFKNSDFYELITQADEFLEKDHIDTIIKIIEQIFKSN